MIIQSLILETKLQQNAYSFHPLVPFDSQKDRLLLMDFTSTNTELNDDILQNTSSFSKYVTKKLEQNNCKYAIGGYAEHRTIYSRSTVFNSIKNEEPRRLHLGTDIWGEPGTPVFAPLGGVVHSFAFNDQYGDYGATIILLHQLNGEAFYTLYGHLSISNLTNLEEGKYICIGEKFGNFGEPFENGNWPPHLHFQVIKDMEGKWGDYPGVCTFSERKKYLDNSPDPDLVLQMMQYAKPAL